MKKESYLFVCTGNTCRSPMAEYMLREMAQERNLDIISASRGIRVSKDMYGATQEACQVLSEVYPQAKIKEHIPRLFNFSDFSSHDKILTMSREQRDILWKAQPGFRQKIFTLREYTGFVDKRPESFDISDPAFAGIWSKKYLEEQGLLGQLNKGSYEVRFDGQTWVIDPVVSMDAYRKVRDEIRECLERICNYYNEPLLSASL